MRSIWSEKKGTFCSVDFEAWERDHTLITEFGWSFIRFGADRTPSEEQGHLIVEEAAGYRNSAYVVDNREVIKTTVLEEKPYPMSPAL